NGRGMHIYRSPENEEPPGRRPDQEPEGPGNEPTPPPRAQRRPGQPPGALAIPGPVLERHGARTLRPTEAITLPGDQRPMTTVYRAGALLIPDEVFADERVVSALNDALRPVGMYLDQPPSLLPGDGDEPGGRIPNLPRQVALQLLRGAP